MSDFLSFHLPEEFLEGYKKRRPDWGFPIGGGNSLGELTFITKYSRLKEDGSKEKWWEVCQRCIEGMYSILKDHATDQRTPWNEMKARAAAQDAYERMFIFKWLPPGRGLWMMGTSFVHENEGTSAPLQNCAFLSTGKLSNHSAKEATLPFTRLMEMSMLGIGVGFDTRGAGNLTFHEPMGDPIVHVIPDSREGWCDSLGLKLESYFFKNRKPVEFDYSLIRLAGIPIKGFGGLAGGPGPLIDLHDKLDKLFVGRGGSLLTSTDITNICNLTAKAVVAAGIRRSATIALGDPYDEDYLNLKNYEVNPERNGEDGWGWASNNSITANVNDDYGHIVDLIGNNGEPGFFFLDLARKYGRLADRPNNKDAGTLGCNPCHSYDSLILTDQGLKEIGSLDGEEFNVWNGSEFTGSTAWKTGVKPVYEVELVNGLKTTVTEDHVLAAWSEEGVQGGVVEMEVQAKAISGMKVRPLLGPGEWEGYHIEPEEALMCGLLFGDGWSKPESHAIFMKNKEPEVLEFLRHMGHETRECNQTLFDTKKILVSHGLDISNPLPERCLPREAYQWSSATMKAFLKGLFSANGTAQSKYSRISLKTTCKELSKQVQKMLIALGYSCYITTNPETDIEWSNGTFTSKESYDVNIGSAFYYNKFQDEIGFLHEHMTNKVSLRKARPTSTRVKSVSYLGVRDVYDFCEPETHWGWVDGFKSHNCGEQNLFDKETCTLVESFPHHHENLEDFLRTLKHAYLYGKAVTLLSTHWPETNEVMQKNRRIGCSVSGLAQFVEARGWGELRTWLDEGYETIQKRDVQYSEWLGVRESIKTTTCKPSGTTSLLAGATPGVHWPVASGTYIRRMRLAKEDPMLEILGAAGYHIEPDVSSPKTTFVVELPTIGPPVRDEVEVSVWEKAELAVLLQRWWSDNMVSCTLTFKESEKDQLPALISAKTGQLKSMSLLPMFESGGAYKQMPYERISEDKAKEMKKGLKPINWKKIYKNGKEAEGERYCTTDTCEI